jgi:hypothetical protein
MDEIMEYVIDNQIPDDLTIHSDTRAAILGVGHTGTAPGQEHFTIANDSEIDKGKESITPPAPKKSFWDRASNQLARTIAQIRTGHWLCAPYVK